MKKQYIIGGLALDLFKDTKLKKETRNYIVQVLGKNGFLELYVVNDI